MSIHLKLLFATVIWGATPTIGRLLASYKAPFVVVFGRFFVATVFLLWFACAARQFVSVPRRHWWRFAVLGATGLGLHNGLLYKSLEYTTATTASIILALIATQIVLLDMIVYRRIPDRLTLTGVILAFGGTAYVITGGELSRVGSMHIGFGECLVFLSGLSWAIYSVVGRDLLDEFAPLLVTTYASAAGLVFLLPSLFFEPAAALAIAADPRALLLIFFLGFVGSALGFLWYYQAVVRMGTVGAAIYLNLVPVFGVLCANLILDEAIDSAVVGGGLLVLAGLAVVNRPRRDAPGAGTRRVAAQSD